MKPVISKKQALSRLARNLSDLSGIRDMSQADVARAILGNNTINSRNKVSRWFLGKVLPSSYELWNLADLLDCSMDDLFSKLSIKRKFENMV